MGHKVNPISLRLGSIYDWKSRWFNKKHYGDFLEEDTKLRNFLLKKLKDAAVSKIDIERSAKSITVYIHTSRPGIIIGRGGTGAEELKEAAKKIISDKKTEVKMNIQEVKDPETNAVLVAQNIAEQLEKRVSFRRTMKQAIDRSVQKNIKGIKVEVSGRLGGTEMSRREWLSDGKLPLHNLRAEIDYAKANAYTTYGVIGVKVWIYKGEVFKRENKKKQKESG